MASAGPSSFAGSGAASSPSGTAGSASGSFSLAAGPSSPPARARPPAPPLPAGWAPRFLFAGSKRLSQLFPWPQVPPPAPSPLPAGEHAYQAMGLAMLPATAQPWRPRNAGLSPHPDRRSGPSHPPPPRRGVEGPPSPAYPIARRSNRKHIHYLPDPLDRPRRRPQPVEAASPCPAGTAAFPPR